MVRTIDHHTINIHCRLLMLQILIDHPLDERGQRGMESATVERSFESQDDRCRRRRRDLYRQKRDKETLQQKQTRRARQKEYHRQRIAEMIPEQHNSLLLQRRERYCQRRCNEPLPDN